LHGDDLVAVAHLAQARHALTPQAELGTGLGAGGQAQLLLAVERGDGEARPERRLSHADLEPVVQVVASALQERVRLHLDVEVEVACRGAVDAGVALARHAQAVAAVDAARQGDLDAVVGDLAPAPVAHAAGRGDDLAGPVAVGAGARRDHRAEDRLRLHAHLARAAAARAGGAAVRARLGALAVAVVARLEALDLDLDGGAVARLLEGDGQLRLEVLARLAALPRPPATEVGAEVGPEHRGEDVEDVAAQRDAVVDAAVAVVAGALLGVGEHGVRLVDLLEPLLGGLVAGVAVGVVGQRQLPVGGLDGLGVCRALYLEDGVVVRHAPASITEGRGSGGRASAAPRGASGTRPGRGRRPGWCLLGPAPQGSRGAWRSQPRRVSD